MNMSDPNVFTSAVPEAREWSRQTLWFSTAIATTLFAFQLQLAQAQTAPTAPSASASASADKGGWQVVETLFGELSFAQIQKHPERAKILDGMKDADYTAYDYWQSGKVQVAIETNKGKLETQKVAINNLSRNAQELEKTVRATLDAKLKIPAKYRPTMENIISFGKPPETVKYFQEVLKDPNNFV